MHKCSALLHVCIAMASLCGNLAQAQLTHLPVGDTEVRAFQTKGQALHVKTTSISTDLHGAYRLAWSPDGKYFAVIGAKGSIGISTYCIVVYDASTQHVIKTLPVKQPGSLLGDIAFSPDGKYLAGGIGIITLWDANTWQPVRNIDGPYVDIPSQQEFGASGVSSITFSPDGRSLAILYDSVSYWPTSVKNKTKEAASSLQALLSASKHDGTFWEKMAKDDLPLSLDTIMVFDVDTKKRVFVQAIPKPSPDKSARFTGNLTYTADGRYLLSARVENRRLQPSQHFRYYTFIELRDPHTGQVVKEIADPHVMQVTTMASSPNGKYIATGTNTTSKDSRLNSFTHGWDLIDNKDPIRLWDVATGKKVMEYGPLRGAARSLAFSPDGELLVSCQTDIEKKETVWLWEAESGQILERVTTRRSGSELFDCALSPDGRSIGMPIVDEVYFISIVK